MSSITKRPQSQTVSLEQMLKLRNSLEQMFEETEGEILNTTLDQVWDDLAIALPVKVNAYGLLIDRKQAEIKQLKELKSQIAGSIESIENKVKSIKNRLYNYATEYGKLEGGIYSFSPKMNESIVMDESKIEPDHPKWKYSLPTLNAKQFEKLITVIHATDPLFAQELCDVVTKKINKTDVAELNPKHPALTSSYEPSVTIGRSKKKIEEMELVEC